MQIHFQQAKLGGNKTPVASAEAINGENLPGEFVQQDGEVSKS